MAGAPTEAMLRAGPKNDPRGRPLVAALLSRWRKPAKRRGAGCTNQSSLPAARKQAPGLGRRGQAYNDGGTGSFSDLGRKAQRTTARQSALMIARGRVTEREKTTGRELEEILGRRCRDAFAPNPLIRRTNTVLARTTGISNSGNGAVSGQRVEKPVIRDATEENSILVSESFSFGAPCGSCFVFPRGRR